MSASLEAVGSSVTRWRVPWLRRLWLAPVRFYQRVVSPLTPAACRFSPTCSQYAIEAVEHRGVLRGTALAIWRVIRCNPFCSGGHDPVPRPVVGRRGDEEGP